MRPLGDGAHRRLLLNQDVFQAFCSEFDLADSARRDDVDNTLTQLLLLGLSGLFLENSLVVKRHDADEEGEEVDSDGEDGDGDAWPELKAIKLIGCDAVTRHSVANFVKAAKAKGKWPTLASLNIKGCPELDAQSLGLHVNVDDMSKFEFA